MSEVTQMSFFPGKEARKAHLLDKGSPLGALLAPQVHEVVRQPRGLCGEDLWACRVVSVRRYNARQHLCTHMSSMWRLCFHILSLLQSILSSIAPHATPDGVHTLPRSLCKQQADGPPAMA